MLYFFTGTLIKIETLRIKQQHHYAHTHTHTHTHQNTIFRVSFFLKDLQKTPIP